MSPAQERRIRRKNRRPFIITYPGGQVVLHLPPNPTKAEVKAGKRLLNDHTSA